MFSTPAMHGDALAAGLGLPTPYLVRIDQRIETARDELEVQHTLLPANETRLVWGAGARQDRVQGEQFYGTSETLEQNVYRLFGNLEWRPGNWVFNLGATVEDDSLSDVSLAPRFSANYHLTAGQTLRGAVSRAYRIPTLTESKARTAYGSFDTSLIPLPFGVLPVEITRQASGNLAPEQIDVQEIAYLGDFHAQRLLVDLRAFREQVSDRIVAIELPLKAPNCELLGLPRCGRATDFVNGQQVEILGLEYQVRWRPRSATELTLNQTWITLDAQANSAFYARDPLAAGAADQHMEHSAPKRATMLRWNERLPFGIEGSIAYYHYSSFQWTVDSSVGPFDRTDIRLAYPWHSGSAKGELALVVQGLGSQRAEYREHAVGATPVTPEFLRSRSWVSLTLAY